MNEFDLRKFLYKNPLFEEDKEEKDDAAKKALDKKEDELDEKDMEHETLKEKIKHHEGAIENIKKELEDLSDDLGEDEEDLKKEKEEVKEASPLTPNKDMRKPADKEYEPAEDTVMRKMMEEEKEEPKLTKESLKSLIREKITSILTEDETEEIENNTDVEVKDDTTVKADIEKEVDVDDESSKAEVEVDGEIAGESSEKAAVLSLLTKAQEMVPSLGADAEKNEKMVNQINNTITMFARDYLAQSPK